MKQPNIIMLMTEDICPNIGCYGDQNARTPWLDSFARENIRFDHCYSAAPTCSPARSSLHLGMYASCAGVGGHWSMHRLPESIRPLACYMRDAGYYTVCGKTDYNFPSEGLEGFDERLKWGTADSTAFAQSIADCLDRAPKNRPILLIQTTALTHQSQYGFTPDTEEHRRIKTPRLRPEEYQDRNRVAVPAYHFDTPEAREIWGQYQENMTCMDRMFGEAIQVLKERNLYENSVILFVGDNGHGIPGGKCTLWDEGVHVPFLLHVPKELEASLQLKTDAHGRYCSRYVDFVDFAPTFLSLAGAPVPEYMQGRVFLGEHSTEDPHGTFSFGERTSAHFGNSRTLYRDQMMYSCDFSLPLVRRINGHMQQFAPWFNASMAREGYRQHITDTDRRAVYRKMTRINETLFDLNNDAAQLHDLAQNPQNREMLLAMRNELFDKIEEYHDGAMMPEPLAAELEAATGRTIYELLRDESVYPIRRLRRLWEDGMDGKPLTGPFELPAEKLLLIRFTAQRHTDKEPIRRLLQDESETVRTYAALMLEQDTVLTQTCENSNNIILLTLILDFVITGSFVHGERYLRMITDRYVVRDDIVRVKHLKNDGALIYAIAEASNRLNCTLDVPEDWKQMYDLPFRSAAEMEMVYEAIDSQGLPIDPKGNEERQ